MKCYHCNGELLWGGDHDMDDIDDDEYIVTNLTCIKCPTYVEVFYKIEKDEDDDNTIN